MPSSNFSLEDLGVSAPKYNYFDQNLGAFSDRPAKGSMWTSEPAKAGYQAGLQLLTGYLDAKAEEANQERIDRANMMAGVERSEGSKQAVDARYATDYFYNRASRDRKRKSLAAIRQNATLGN